MPIAIQSTGHPFLEDLWKEVQKATLPLTTTAGVLVTGLVVTINEIRKTPFVEIVLNDEDHLVNIKFRVEGNIGQGPTNWENINHVTGEFIHPVTGDVVNQPRVQPIPPKDPTHLFICDTKGAPVFVYQISKQTRWRLVLEYEQNPPAEIMTEFARRRNGKGGPAGPGNRAPATGQATGTGITKIDPPLPPKAPKLTLQVKIETLIKAAERSLANQGARESVVMTARDTPLRVTLHVVTDPKTQKFNLVQELTIQQGSEKAVTLPFKETSHPYVQQVTTPSGGRHQLHHAPDQLRFTIHEVPLDDTYELQRRRWGMKEYPDLQRAADELQKSVKTLREQVTVTSSAPPHLVHGQSMIVTIGTPSGKPGGTTYTKLTFYYHENWGWSFIDPSSLPPSVSSLPEELLAERSRKFSRSPLTTGKTNFGESCSVPPYRAYPSYPGRGISFPYNLVVNTQTGAVFLIDKGIDIEALTPEALGEYETRFFDRTSVAKATEEIPASEAELKTRRGLKRGPLSRGGPFGSRHGFVTTDLLLAPITFPFYAAEQINWSAVKNLSLRGGINLVNFGVPLVGGIGSELALRGCETLTGHQFSETTHHVGSLWGLAESSYLWGKYGKWRALTTTGRGTSYLHFIRSLPAFELGSFGAKWIGEELFGVQKGSMADLALGFTGGLALGMGTELLLQLPQFKQFTPLMTVAGLAYLIVSNSSFPFFKQDSSPVLS